MNPTRRKLAIATWSGPREPNIYGKMTLDATHALAYVEHLRAETGKKVSITHVIGRAVGEAISKTPELNGRIVFGRYVPHDTVSVAFLEKTCNLPVQESVGYTIKYHL